MGDHSPSPSPSQDFHTILGVAKSASIKDICKAYKNLVLRWHPDKHSNTNKSEAEAKFKSINEAYVALRDKGSQGDHQGNMYGGNYFSDEDSSVQSGYKHRSVDNFFSSTTTPGKTGFLSRNASRRSFGPAPAPSALPKSASRRSSATPIMFSSSTARKKPPPIEKRLECTLEELCYGCVKKIKITRNVFTDTGTIVQEEELLRIKVKPGWKKGMKITFEGVGDERPGSLPADVTFLIEEKTHPVFRREADDLEIPIEIPLVQALTGCNITVPLISGEKMNLQLNDIIQPGHEKIIAGQGMPCSREQGRRGDLRIKFQISFPTELSDEQRSEILSLLHDESP